MMPSRAARPGEPETWISTARSISRALALGLATALAAGCGQSPGPVRPEASSKDLVGAWRSTVRFQTGAFAGIKDLEFLYVYNLGGTMTESSNYDGAPPVPPAYGIWRRVGPDEYEAKYEFYVTKPPSGLDDITRGGGWLPSGRGAFVERVTVSADGLTFASKIRYEALDPEGRSVEGGGEAEGRGTRLRF